MVEAKIRQIVGRSIKKQSTEKIAAKRRSRYRVWLTVIIASIGINISPLFHGAGRGETTRAVAFSTGLLEQSKQSESVQAEDTPAVSAVVEGISFIRSNNVPAAIQAFERAVSLDPSLVAAHYNLGLAFRQDEQLQAAASSFWQAIQADPTFVLGYVNLGAALLEGDNTAQAKDYLTRALELDPELGIAHYNMGLLHKREGNLPAAFASFNQGLNQPASAAKSHYQIGLIYLSQQQYSNAQKAFENAVKLDKTYTEAHYNLGVSFVRQNSPVTAIIAFNNALNLQPDFAHAYYAKALALADLQRYEEAKQTLIIASTMYLSQGNTEWATIAQHQITFIETTGFQ